MKFWEVKKLRKKVEYFNNFNENERNRRDESTVFNDQNNEIDNIRIKKLRSF